MIKTFLFEYCIMIMFIRNDDIYLIKVYFTAIYIFKDMELEETVNKLKEFIYPPGYVDHDSDYDDLESSESEK